MTAGELFELKGIRARLAVICTCEGGRSRIGVGDEPAGIGTALLVAGTRSVVAPLWRVGDGPTERLMKEFYDKRCDGDIW